jgi:hypothetical protein
MLTVPSPALRRFWVFLSAMAGWWLLSCALGFSAEVQTNRFSYLDNGTIKIGVDLDHGGSIGYLAESHGGSNIVNLHDYGRWIGQSYYSGPQPFGEPHPGWKNWPWNPVSAGDAYGHSCHLLDHTNDGQTLYVKSTPMQWALNNVPGDCTFETWITLEGHAVKVRNRLTNLRTDHTRYPARDQELPAVYTIGKLYRLFTYDGSNPFQHDALREVPRKPPAPNQFPWSVFDATESWAALVNDADWGLGVYHPGTIHFLGGFNNRANIGGPYDDSTGYIAPTRQEILDHNIVYEFEYTLILDSLLHIRQYVYEHPPRRLPDYRFTKDRQHWRYVNASDTGFPIQNHLHVVLDQNDPQMLSSETCWDAQEVPKLYLRAAFHTHQNHAELFWQTREQPGFSAERKVAFTIQPDGEFHTYEIELAKSSAYQGKITALRFDPVPAGETGDYVEVEFISYQRE